MNNYRQGRIFTQALQEADTGDTVLSADDWARTTGMMHDYGHGYIFETFTKQEAIAAIEAAARDFEEAATAQE